MKIWAHRGCSQMYPENTLLSFGRAMEIDGLAGIELDIQLTKDGELVVIHDERVDRTTDGFGFVRDYTLKEIKALNIFSGIGEKPETIPTMREVLDLLLPKLKMYEQNEAGGIRLNIELKTSIWPYPGIEEKIVSLLSEYGLKNSIVYSSFWAESLVKLHELDKEAELGVLDTQVSNCLYKAIGLEALWGGYEGKKLALHPGGFYMDIPRDKVQGRTVRGFFGGHLFPDVPTGGKMNLEKLAEKGVTDVFFNEPEKYCES